jgi:hypothetical protein
MYAVPVLLNYTAFHHVIVDQHKPGRALLIDTGIFTVRRIKTLARSNTKCNISGENVAWEKPTSS